MKVLFDASHPAHVHLFRPLAERVRAEGGEVLVVGRAKDVTLELLEGFGLPHELPSIPTRRAAPPGGPYEFLHRVRFLRTMIRDWRPDVLMTRNPTGAVAGFRTGTWTVFDTDDGRSVGRHYWTARPFADVITSSLHDPEHHGPRHRRYRSIKALGFLSPPAFEPDGSVVRRYGALSNRLFTVRFSRHDASHDRGVRGIDRATRDRIVELLLQHGDVLLSSEGEGTRLFQHLDGADDRRPPVDVGPMDFHHLLAASALCVGDSQSVAAEAAVLGVPALRLSSFSGRTFYLSLLEDDYRLIQNFRPGEEADLLVAIERALLELNVLLEATRSAAIHLRQDSEDLTAWFLRLLGDLASTPKSGAARRALLRDP